MKLKREERAHSRRTFKITITEDKMSINPSLLILQVISEAFLISLEPTAEKALTTVERRLFRKSGLRSS